MAIFSKIEYFVWFISHDLLNIFDQFHIKKCILEGVDYNEPRKIGDLDIYPEISRFRLFPAFFNKNSQKCNRIEEYTDIQNITI
jgi:hypothetical protein